VGWGEREREREREKRRERRRERGDKIEEGKRETEGSERNG
jgi:hypothetical protein